MADSMADSMADKELHITVVSDVVCPWCFIGLRRLQAALSQWPGPAPVHVAWQAYQLNPDMPAAGLDRGAYEQRKFGARRAAVRDRIAQAGAEVGIAFDFDRIARQPNTLALHAIIASARDARQQWLRAQALFEGFFLSGVDMTQAQAVAQWLAPVGASPTEVSACFDASGDAQALALAQDRHWRDQGVDGVPMFVFNRHWAVTGAQPEAVLLRAMSQAMT